jgi:hypothetical protein
MSKKSFDSVGLAVTTIGGILVYAGIRGYSVMVVVQNLITGKPITTGVNVTNPLTTGSESDSSTSDGNTSTVTGSPKTIGKSLAAGMGWTGSQWSALETLWDHESNWNPKAKNKSSGAYGIPQALPYSKMPKAAWPESAGGTSDASTQIQWGLTYIKGRYGTPALAWAFWQRQSPHWY